MKKTLLALCALLVGAALASGQIAGETIVLQIRTVPNGPNVTTSPGGVFYNNNEAWWSQGTIGQKTYGGLLSQTWCHALVDDGQGGITTGPKVGLGFITTTGVELEGGMAMQWGTSIAYTFPEFGDDWFWKRASLFQGQGPPSGLWINWVGDQILPYWKDGGEWTVSGEAGWVAAGTSAVFESDYDLWHLMPPWQCIDVRVNSDEWELWVGTYDDACLWLDANGIDIEDTVFP